MIALQYEVAHFLIGLLRPIIGVGFVQALPSHHAQVVHQVTTAYDQYALVSQLSQAWPSHSGIEALAYNLNSTESPAHLHWGRGV